LSQTLFTRYGESILAGKEIGLLGFGVSLFFSNGLSLHKGFDLIRAFRMISSCSVLTKGL